MEKHTFGRDFYDFITAKVNKPLVFFLGHIFDRLPEPTKDNTNWPNTHILIDIRDEFFKHENNMGRYKALRAIFNIFIIKYDYDPYYRKRIDWVIDRILHYVVKGDLWVSHAKRLESDQWWIK